MKVLLKSFVFLCIMGLVACDGPKNKTEDPGAADTPTDSPTENETQESEVEIKVIGNEGEDFPVIDLLPKENIVYYVAEERNAIYYRVSEQAEVMDDLDIEETEEGWVIGEKVYTALPVDEMDETILWPWSGSNPTKLTDYSCTAIACIKGGKSWYDAVNPGESLCAYKKGSTCQGKAGAIGARRYNNAQCTGTGTRVTLPGVVCP